MRKGSLPPAIRIFAPDDLAGADQRGRTLKLLEREQSQGVAHQHRHPRMAAVPGDHALEPADG
jgi:hypothetical protein